MLMSDAKKPAVGTKAEYGVDQSAAIGAGTGASGGAAKGAAKGATDGAGVVCGSACIATAKAVQMIVNCPMASNWN
jgi:hypothetical protein